MFEPLSLLVLALLYLSTLFFIAWASERLPWLDALASHPVCYVLALAVYGSVFTMYGIFGFARSYGDSHLLYFAGPVAAFLALPLMLKPLMELTHRYRLNSLADLLTFRYRSQWAGSFTTVMLTFSVLPLLAMQIQAIAESVDLASDGGANSHVIPFVFYVLVGLFTLQFGTGELSAKGQHRGLIIVIAMESLFKLFLLLLVGGFAIWGVFGGISEMQLWAAEHHERIQPLIGTADGSGTRYMLLIFFGATVCMPHFFHMLFTEKAQPEKLRFASWALPLYFLLIAIPVIPILWAGLATGSTEDGAYAPLTLAIALDQPLLALLVFYGGLAAASGTVVVIILALASMWLNHMVLPFYTPRHGTNIYLWLRRARQALIVALLLTGYLFFVITPQRDLSALGMASLMTATQFLPAVVAILYWARATSTGLLLGLGLGFAVWIGGMINIILETGTATPPAMAELSEVAQSYWVSLCGWSLAVNVLGLIIGSMMSRQSKEEAMAGQTCSLGNTQPTLRRLLNISRASDIKPLLAKAVGDEAAEREFYRALDHLQLLPDERRPTQLKRLRDELEVNLSDLMGPSVAHGIVQRWLPYAPGEQDRDDLSLLEARMEANLQQLTGLAGDLDKLRRHHRETLTRLPVGLCAVSSDAEIVLWNDHMAQLTHIDAASVIGSTIDDLPRAWRRLLSDFLVSADSSWQRETIEDQGRKRWISLHQTSPDLGLRDERIIVAEDVTASYLSESKLSHQQRLASIGRLAAGMAHEIGNPVTGIACLAQNLQQEDDLDEVQEAADQIVQQTQRISSIVQSLVNFAHGGQEKSNLRLQAVNLGHCVGEAIKLLSLDREAIPVQFENHCGDDNFVEADFQRLLQIFINLLSNARDASEPDQLIVIQCRLDARQRRTLIEVRDQGSGIPKHLRQQVLEPFFTTKEPGKGTGLGLALVYSMMQEMAGELDIESPCDPIRERGTCIHLSLPLAN